MTVIDKHYADLVDDDAGKTGFINNRPDAIVIVKCVSSRINYFWKFALQTCIGFNMIYDLFKYIKNDSHSTVAYYKVFIKAGNYPYYYDDYNHNFNQHYIEINGSKIGTTTLFGNKACSILYIINFAYLSIKYVRFNSLFVQASNYEYNSLRHMDDNRFIKAFGYSELFVSNCIFENYKSGLGITSISKSTIINCQFYYEGLQFCDSVYDYDINRMAILKIDKIAECNIFYSTFVIQTSLFGCIYIESALTYNILFSNNNILKTSILFDNEDDNQTTIMVTDNIICNVNVCMKNCHGTRFSNNHFDNIKLLYDKLCANTILDNTNIFTNCGEQLMNQIKIENAMQ